MAQLVEDTKETETGEYPNVVLVVIHGLRNETKHKALQKVAEDLNMNIIIPSNENDKKELTNMQRAELYQDLIKKYNPDMIIGQSSGGNVISSLVVDLNIWTKPTWIISARLIEKIYKQKFEDLPILFSHGTNDNLAYMNGLCANKFSRCKLVPFEGDHYAQNLFVGDNAVDNIKELLKMCYALRWKKPKKISNKLSINEMMKNQFAEKK